MSFKHNTTTNRADQIAMRISRTNDYAVVKPKTLKEQYAEMEHHVQVEKVVDEMEGVRVGNFIPSVEYKNQKEEKNKIGTKTGR